MTLLFIGLGVIALVLPGARPSVSLRGDPRRFAVLDTAALALGLASIVVGLGLSVAIGVLHVAAGTALASYEGHLAPGGIAGSAASGIALGLLAFRLGAVGRRARRGRRVAYADRWLGHHHDRGDHELVVLPTAASVAYCVQGSPPQVVISQGLQDELGNDLLAFVVDHERAHLRRRHRRSLFVAACADAVFGRIAAVSRSTLALRLTVERAADEEAVGTDPQQRRRVGAALRVLGEARLPGCATDAIQYRAGLLIAAPSASAVRLEASAVAGLLAIVVVAVVLAGHVGGDLPTLVATLR